MIEANENESAPEGQRRNSMGREVWEILKVLFISLAIVLPVRYFIVQPFIVRGASMEPNFEDREYLIIDELSYYFRGPKRGETIVFRYPQNTTQFFIKRIVGLPGETINIKDGDIYIENADYPQGFLFEEPYLSAESRVTRPATVVALEQDEYFVLGDNRDFSSDSRSWGPLRREFMVGRVLFRAWPLNRFGTIPDYSMEY